MKSNHSELQSSEFPSLLYTAAQVRELDRVAIEEFNDPGISLMEHAGDAVFNALCLRKPRTRRIAVICGGGNNGGDGYVVARLAVTAGMRVVIYQLGDVQRLQGDALTAYERLEGTRVEIHAYNGQPFEEMDVIVDAMLGTGLNGEVTGVWRLAIEAVNAAAHQGSYIVACDIPSGLHADSGSVLGAAVNANLTVTFIGMKQGLLTAMGPDHCGEIVFNDLQVPHEIYSQVENSAVLLSNEMIDEKLIPRRPSTHKGQCGRVLVVGGNHGMSGAVRLAGEAAYRTGAGLVTIATRSKHAEFINATRPELMCHGIESVDQINPLIERADIIAIGPGLGQDPWAQALLSAVLQSQLPLVVDADALQLLALEPEQRENWVLTPHPGEAAALLEMSVPQIQSDRFAAIKLLHQKYAGIMVLKGCGSLIYSSDTTYLCPFGNPGMASGGMGDVLTGVIAGLVAQGIDLADSAKIGVGVHAWAADSAAGRNSRGLLASDLLPYIRYRVNN